MERKVEEIVQEIKQVDGNITNILVPILQDTINDYKKVNGRLIGVIIMLIIVITIIVGYALYKNTTILNKYNEFLSQFEFESSEYMYTQDVDSQSGNSIITDGIHINDK